MLSKRWATFVSIKLDFAKLKARKVGELYRVAKYNATRQRTSVKHVNVRPKILRDLQLAWGLQFLANTKHFSLGDVHA